MTLVADAAHDGVGIHDWYDEIWVEDFEYIAPIKPGDGRIKSRGMTTDVSIEKQTRPGKGVFITSVTEYRTEIGDKLVARSTMTLLMYDSNTPRGDQ